jgi:methylated-DNA-protein-cysteine methyltransferase related protein
MDSFEQVYEVVKLIPAGKVSSYGAIAKYLSTSPRLVGWAMNACHGRPEIPAHRVVNRNGLLTGKMHFASPTLMQEKLEEDGIEVKNDAVQRFKEVFWDPRVELI